MNDPDRTPATETTTTSPSFLHPASGGLILGADWLLFSGTAATGGLAMPLTMVLGFLIGSIGTTACQRKFAKESWGKAMGKGLLAGLAVGAPFPIGGTIVGGTVLASSGLHQLRERAAKALLEKTKDSTTK
tara:strand:+ start:265 stop:657 length:393 start_codon:yes stop_codon:yes gene_type:complete